MPTITLRRVNALPIPPEPSTLYFVKGTGTSMAIYMTSRDGQVTYSAQAVDQQAVDAYLEALRDVPNGLAGLDDHRLLSPQIGINGQDVLVCGPALEPLWADNVAPFVTTPTGKANNPDLEVVYGNFQGLTFSKDTMNQVWVDFHIDHDIALGKKLYPHIHWMPYTTHTGTVRWGIEYCIAKGHGQQVFTSSTTVYVMQSIGAGSQYRHMVAEVSDADAILSNNIEPDSFIKMRIFRDPTHPLDTFNAKVHAWCCDLHYQIARFGTINKKPNFFGAGP